MCLSFWFDFDIDFLLINLCFWQLYLIFPIFWEKLFLKKFRIFYLKKNLRLNYITIILNLSKTKFLFEKMSKFLWMISSFEQQYFFNSRIKFNSGFKNPPSLIGELKLILELKKILGFKFWTTDRKKRNLPSRGSNPSQEVKKFLFFSHKKG
jgi:hypothetical protein